MIKAANATTTSYIFIAVVYFDRLVALIHFRNHQLLGVRYGE